MKQQDEVNSIPLEQQLESHPEQQPAVPLVQDEREELPDNGLKQKPKRDVSENRTLGVGEWMVTMLFFLLPIVNIVVMAIWAFSSNGNIHRKNFSRACLLWIIILLLGYVVAMTVAGYTIFDIFTGRL
ncbi:MAG: hypothetical protein GX115_15890 [Ruminiclostridium sp.]|nr:hypothetical protein [Ruminiclostridium sp.]